MKYYSLVLMALLPHICHAQNVQLNLFGGVASYVGDLQGKRITFNQSHPAIGLGVSYDLSSKVIVRTGFTYAVVSGDDKKNNTAKGIEFRNLRFKSAISELHAGVEYNFFELNGKSLTPYVFAGVALYHFNPYTYDNAGNKVFLKPLSTEGQGLAAYPDRKNYNLTQFAIPFGGGIKMQISDNVQIGLEVGLRKLFTDYLDDVSLNYVDGAILLNEKGPKAVELAYRGNEITGNSGYPAAGTQRGNPTYKDWYYFSGLRISKRLNDKAGRIANRANKLRCPTTTF
jgi:opacity protein-like surface antigen